MVQSALALEEADVALSHLTHAHRVDDRVTECIHEQQIVHVAVNLTEHVHPPLDHLRVDLHLGTDHNNVTDTTNEKSSLCVNLETRELH